VRSNTDIDWAIHGQIKDLAEETNLNLSDAYTEALESSIESRESQDSK
jgi:hypothetical protein